MKELIEAKLSGSFGEIAFNEFCRLFIPPKLWKWYHREALEENAGEVTEYDQHDFEVCNRDIDVKTSEVQLVTRVGKQFQSDAVRDYTESEFESPDIYVIALFRRKKDTSVSLDERDTTILAVALPKRQGPLLNGLSARKIDQVGMGHTSRSISTRAVVSRTP